MEAAGETRRAVDRPHHQDLEGVGGIQGHRIQERSSPWPSGRDSLSRADWGGSPGSGGYAF